MSAWERPGSGRERAAETMDQWQCGRPRIGDGDGSRGDARSEYPRPLKREDGSMGSRGVRAPASRVSLVVGLAVVAMCLVLATPARATTPQTFHVTLGAANADMSLMGMAFYPASLTVHQGDVLVFTDDLIEPHTVTFGVSGPIGNPFAFEAPQNLTGPGTGTYSGNMILNSGILVVGGPFGNSLAVTIDVGS